MTKSELQQTINDIIREKPDNIMSIYFARKSTSSKYKSYQPQVSNQVQKEIVDMVLTCLQIHMESLQLVEYSPVGVADGELETLSKVEVPQVDEFLRSITTTELLTDSENLDISKIDFYCIKIEYNGSTLFLFRQFSKLKKLRKGFWAQLISDELVAMDKDFLGIDETSDIVYADNDLFILNHVSLERIFSYRDQYLQKTNEAMGEIFKQAVLVNIEQFSEDCCRDVRIMKRLTDIMSKGRLPLFFENYDKVPVIVKELGIDIEFDEEHKIIYRDKNQLFPLIYLMSDAYFRSLIAERTGIAKTEEAIDQ